MVAVSFEASAATVSVTRSFTLDNSNPSTGFGVNEFRPQPGQTLVGVSLTIDATVTYDSLLIFSSPWIPPGGGLPTPPLVTTQHEELLTIDDQFGSLFDPKVLGTDSFGSCSSTSVVGIPTFWRTECTASGSSTFSSVPVNVTGIIPDDFVGFDIINFSAVSSYGDIVFSNPSGVLTSLFESRNFEWLGTYTLTYTYVPVPPAVWLFGSGLLGLIGIARKKAA
jgi:hypothetical protein